MPQNHTGFALQYTCIGLIHFTMFLINNLFFSEWDHVPGDKDLPLDADNPATLWDLLDLRNRLPAHQVGKTTYVYSTVHCNENPIYVFLFWELRGLSPNFHIHVSLNDLYLVPGSVHIFGCSKIDRPILEIYKSFTDIKNCRIGRENIIMLFWK